MTPYFEVCRMPRPDEFFVRVVNKKGPYRGMWVKWGTFPTRSEAMEEARRLEDPERFSHIGIEPHVKDAGCFQTSPLQEVWVA